jgi:hypothetical protein
MEALVITVTFLVMLGVFNLILDIIYPNQKSHSPSTNGAE